MRIDTLSGSNSQTQGAQRRAWFRRYAPEHLDQSAALIKQALALRSPSASQSTLVLGAGACTEVPLELLARSSEEVVLVDFDLPSMLRARGELASPALQKRIRFVQADITGGVSSSLDRQIKRQPWPSLVEQGVDAFFDAATACIELIDVPEPPVIDTLRPGDFGLVISSLVLSQLFSYPLLDMLDHIQNVAPDFLFEQERHRHYQDASQIFRMRVIASHLHLLSSLLDTGGVIALLTDIRAFAFREGKDERGGTPGPRRTVPIVPRLFPELLQRTFTIVEEKHWEWITDLPEKERPGRGYEVVGYILKNP